MKRITLLLTLSLISLTYQGWSQLFLTELADPDNEAGARFVEIYNAGASAVDLSTGWDLQRWTNDYTDPQSPVELTGTIPAGGFYIVCANQTTFTDTYGFAADQNIGTNGPADSNGDDQIALRDPSDVIVDIFGVPGEDGSGTNHEFEDGRAERKATVTAGNATYDFSEWNVWNDTGGAGTTNLPQNAPDDFDPGAWIGAAAGPVITVSPNSLSGFSYIESIGGPSVSQSFTVEGTDLTDDIVVTPPTNNYEISSDDITYQSTSITLTESGGVVTTTIIYARLKAGLAAGDYIEDIVMSSTDATDKTVSCEGSVIAIEALPFSESFDDSALPTGWSSADFTIENSANAGGTPNEAELAFYNANAGTSQITTPPINSTGKTELILSWNQSVDFYEGGSGADFTVQVLTSTDGSNFSNVAWDQVVAADESAQKIVTLDAADGVGSETFYVRWFFYQNNTDRLSYWNIDDVSIADQIEWANVQWPGSGTITLGDSYTVYAQIFKSGVTEPGGQGSNITAWIGYSLTDTDPSTWTDWVPATYNTDAGNNDEYMAEIGSSILTSGNYYYASRFQYGAGPFVYGGYNVGGGGFWDGTTNVSGVLFVNPSGVQIDWCNLQWPGSGTITFGGDYDVYAQVNEDGITNSPGQGAGITAWIGFSTTDTDPSTWTDWVEASYNTDIGDNDEYVANLGSVIPGPGTYYYASRFKLDVSDYVYGGYNGGGGGFWDGITNVSGVLNADNPTLPDIFISEVVDPLDDFTARYVELYNASGSIIDFGSQIWYLSRQANGSPTSWADVLLTGILNPGECYIVAYNQSGFTSNFGFEADLYNGAITGNGDDGYYLYTNGDHVTGTLVDSYGVIDEDGTNKPWEYLDSKAVRLRSVSTGNATWTASEWHVSMSASTSDMTPDLHMQTKNWQGTISTDWNSKGTNWDGTYGYIPDASDNVLVSAGPLNQPVINGESATFDLTVDAGASVEIASSGSLTVNGTYTNNGDLTIKSDASGTGSLVTTSSVYGTMERYYEGSEWHLISSPIQSEAQAGMFTGLYLQYHTESTNAYTDIIDPATTLNEMQGYALWNDATATANFTGTFKAGSSGSGNNLKRSGAPASPTEDNFGWNLVGNPYPSTIDWDAAGWTKTNLNNATYIHVNSSTWATYINGAQANGGSQYIAPGQGFFVSVMDGGGAYPEDGTLIMTDAVRTAMGSTFYKSTEATGELVRLQVSGNGYADETVIRFVESASAEFDADWDAHKLFAFTPEAPQIFSNLNGYLSINSLPQTNVVPIDVKAGQADSFTISALETGTGETLILEDLFTGETTDLLNSSYTFNYNVADENRFLLHFTTLGISENNASELFNIYSFGSEVYVSSSELATGSIHVYNLMGQEITQKQLNNELTRVSIDRTGYYIVNVVSDKGISSEKVFIQ
ncbi:MAG: lamin tail domain-containing protein [Bacteroidetes bacterium]|nr:lamin tail domain-containing protein [Bacteroidota bacterium]